MTATVPFIYLECCTEPQSLPLHGKQTSPPRTNYWKRTEDFSAESLSYTSLFPTEHDLLRAFHFLLHVTSRKGWNTEQQLSQVREDGREDISSNEQFSWAPIRSVSMFWRVQWRWMNSVILKDTRAHDWSRIAPFCRANPFTSWFTEGDELAGETTLSEGLRYTRQPHLLKGDVTHLGGTFTFIWRRPCDPRIS